MSQMLEEFGDGTWVPYSGGVVMDSTWNYPIDLGSLPQVMGYNGAGDLETITVGPDKMGNMFRQTMTYVGGKVSTVSAWVKL